MALVDRSLGQPSDVGQRDAIVDPQHQPLVGDLVRGEQSTVPAQQVENLGKVELALCVVGAEPRQRLEERLECEHEDPRVHLPDLPLGLRRVALLLGLDDLHDPAVAIPDDPPVAGGVIEHRRRHRRGGSGGGMGLDQLGDRLGADERDIAAEDQHRGPGIETLPQLPDRVPDGPARPVGALLDGELDPGGKHALGRPLARVDDDDPSGARLESGHHRPEDHRAPADLVQDLGGARAHPRTSAGGEDQNGGCTHSQDARRWPGGPGGSWGAGTRTPILRTKT